MIKAKKGIRGAIKELSGKSSDFELFFFSRYFLVFFTRFMALFMAGNTHSLLFSNILLMHHQSSTDAIRKKIFCQERKKTASIAVVLVLFPNPWYFFSCACFLCQIFREKLCACVSVGAFCKADIYAKSKGEQLSTFSEKMHINDLTFGQFFCTEKV